MGERNSLLDLREEIQQLGQEAYQLEPTLCPGCRLRMQAVWRRLDDLDSKTQGYAVLEEENFYLRNKIDRHLDFGEPLERF
jgi:hypothetical protein